MRILAAIVMCLGALIGAAGSAMSYDQEAYLNLSQTTDMFEGFKNPPRIARPLAWMWWHSGFVSKEGITKDWNAMPRTAWRASPFSTARGSMCLTAASIFMTKQSRDCYRHGVNEAARLGLEFGFHMCAGQSESGGPWITPELSMKNSSGRARTFVAAAKCLFVFRSPLPVAVITKTRSWRLSPPSLRCPNSTRNSRDIHAEGCKDPANAIDGCGTSWAVFARARSNQAKSRGLPAQEPVAVSKLVVDFAKWTQSKGRVNRFVWDAKSAIDVRVQSVDANGSVAKDIATFTIDENPLTCGRLVFRFGRTEARCFRVVFEFRGAARLVYVAELALLGVGETPLWDPEIPSIEAKLSHRPRSGSRLPSQRETHPAQTPHRIARDIGLR